MVDDFSWNIVGSIIGAIISAAVGIFLVLYTSKKREHEWLQQNVYRVLYNQISDFKEVLFYLQSSLPNPWNQVDNYSKLKIETHIRDMFEKYSEAIERWNVMHKEIDTDFSYKEAALGEIFKDCFAKAGLLNSGGMIILDERSTQEPRQWVHEFHFVLFNLFEIKDSETLYEMLIAHASAKNGHRRWLQRFKTQSPQLFDCIFEKLPQARKLLESDIKDEELLKQKEIIKDLVSKLKHELEMKIK